MKIDVRKSLKDYEGKPILEVGRDGKKQPLTIRSAFSMALNGNIIRNGQVVPMTAEDKAKIYQLCTKIYNRNKPDFTAHDMSFIKTRAGEVAVVNALVAGKIGDLFERKNSKVDSKQSKV